PGEQGGAGSGVRPTDQADTPGVAGAGEYMRSHKAQLAERALEGKPPAAPEPPAGEPFTVRGEPATYAWVEIGPPERESLGLMNANEADGPGSRWHNIADPRAKGEAYPDLSYGHVLFYSRVCTNTHLSEAQRQEKKFEYFVLCRTSDTVKVGGAVTITAFPTQDQRGNAAIGFRFNSAGGA